MQLALSKYRVRAHGIALRAFISSDIGWSVVLAPELPTETWSAVEVLKMEKTS